MTIAEEVADLLQHTLSITGRVVAGAAPLFAHPQGSGSATRATRALFPEGPPPVTPPTPAGGEAGGLRDGAERAGQDYGGNVTAAALTDEKLTELLKQIFASNAAAGDKVQSIVTDIQTKARQVGPELGDPAAVMVFHQFLDQKFGEVQKLLADSRVDATTQAAIMDALGSEYKTNSPADQGSSTTAAGTQTGGADEGAQSGSEGGSSGGGEASGSEGGDRGGSDGGTTGVAGGETTGASGGGVIDPLAGIGLGGLEPMASMMGPAMAGLGALPGGFGGLGGLGGLTGGGVGLEGLGPALGSLIPGLRDLGIGGPGGDGTKGFSDTSATSDRQTKDPQFGDTTSGAAKPEPQSKPDQPFGDNTTGGGSAAPDKPGAGGPLPAEAGGTPVPAGPAAGSGQVPAGDAGRTVTLPDGTPVSAPNDRRAAAMRAVLSGSTVAAAYDGGVPPPGTPVLSPVSRNELAPGDYAQFATKAPIMYMGRNRIWMDGQLQPISALHSGPDFLGWCQPPGGAHSQPTSPPVPPTPPGGK